MLLNNIARNWEVLERDHAARGGAAARRAPTCHAAAALAAEPESWVLHHALARLYLKVAGSRPDYMARAEYHLDRSRILAPNLDPMEAPRARRGAHRGAR